MADLPEIGICAPEGPLTFIERLCVSAALAAGHALTVFHDGPAPDLPDGARSEAADRIAPPGPGFRAALLRSRPGMIWLAPDICLLAPLRPDRGRLFGWESEARIGDGVLALPPDSPALKAETADALTRALRDGGEIGAALPRAALNPIPFADRRLILRRGAPGEARLGPETLALRLHGERLKQMMAAEGGLPKYWSLLGKLLRRHGVDPRAFPLPGPPPTATGWTAKPEPKRAARKAPATKRVLIVTTMKNEGPFILEWIAHHRALGVTDFLVYTNDCDDGTDAMHDLLAAKGIITEHRDNPYRKTKGVRPQHAALADAQKRPAAKKADWIIPVDVDEFITIHVGEGRFQDLLEAVPDANMISMPWRLFGAGFDPHYRDEFVTERFTDCAPERCPKPHQAWGFKTAFRTDGIYRKFGVHRPVGLKPKAESRINWVGGDGRRMPKAFHKSGWRMDKRCWGYGLVTLNHYALRSAESFLVKRDRGRVNHVDRDQGLAYWFRMNHNAVQDRAIARRAAATRAEFDRLMADPEIAAQHHACVAAHRARIIELKQRPDYAALFDTIRSPRMQALSRMLGNFGNAIFLEGPEAVPAEFLARADEMGALEHA